MLEANFWHKNFFDVLPRSNVTTPTLKNLNILLSTEKAEQTKANRRRICESVYCECMQRT